MTEVLWVGNDGVPAEFVDADDLDVRCVPVDSAYEAVSEGGVDCVVYDPRGEGDEAPDFLHRLKDESPDLPCIVAAASEVFADGGTDTVFDHVPRRDGWEDVLVDVVRTAVEERTHLSYPVPDDEERRLREVKKVTELDLSGSFDRLTEIAQRCFDADMCFVGVLEDSRELFVSCRGESIEELPREQTVCTYQILDEGVTVVRDILDDPRFENRETLHELGLRFYAGASVTVDGGTRIGSFCVMDTEPRDFTAEESRLLRLFADEAAEKVELLRGME